MKLIILTSLSGPTYSLVPGEVHDCGTAEALRLIAAEIAKVHPDSEEEFAEAQAAADADAQAAADADAQAAADADAQAAADADAQAAADAEAPAAADAEVQVAADEPVIEPAVKTAKKR
jgi:hypothetical protein